MVVVGGVVELAKRPGPEPGTGVGFEESAAVERDADGDDVTLGF